MYKNVDPECHLMATVFGQASAVQKKVKVSINGGKSFSDDVFFLELWSMGNTNSVKTIEVKGDQNLSGAFRHIQFAFDKDHNYIFTKSDTNQKGLDEKYRGTASEFTVSGLSSRSANTIIRIGKTNNANEFTEQHNGPAERVEVRVSGEPDKPAKPTEGIEKNEGNRDPNTWKIVNMKDDPAKFKVVDDANKNIATDFTKNETAQQYINYFKFNYKPNEQKETVDTGEKLPLNPDGTVTLPGGEKVPAKNKLIESIYGNQIRRTMDDGKKEGGTFEATAPGGRANGVVQGYIVLPSGIVGMKENGKDEGTIILKDNHGPGGDENKQYKIWFEYENGGRVTNIVLGREHKHPNTEDIEGVTYENRPQLEPGDRLEFKASYQDTNDGGVRLRMDYKDPTSGQWKRMFDHVDYGDDKKDRPYTGKSGVQDGTRVDGRVGGGAPSKEDREKYDRIAKEKPIGTTDVIELKDCLSKLATSAIWAREIEPDNSDLHDGINDPLSVGPKKKKD